MNNNEFLAAVQRGADLSSHDEAGLITRAVLETLADHLAGNAPAKLAAQLPEEIGEYITNYKNDPDAEGEGITVAEFINRVAEKTDAETAEISRKQSIAVLSILREAVSEGEFNKMRGTLPPEYDELFGAGTFAESPIGDNQ